MRRREFLPVLASLAACSKPAPQKRYSLRGEVLSLDPATQIATIKGEKIEGWMEAMTMEYPVKDKSEFARLQPGQKISATVVVTDASYHLENIQLQ